jgi:hypothetical protein
MPIPLLASCSRRQGDAEKAAGFPEITALFDRVRPPGGRVEGLGFFELKNLNP